MIDSTLYIEEKPWLWTKDDNNIKERQVWPSCPFCQLTLKVLVTSSGIMTLKDPLSAGVHTLPSPQQTPLSQEKLCCKPSIDPPYPLPWWIFKRDDPYLRRFHLEPFNFMILCTQKKLLWIFEISLCLMLVILSCSVFFQHWAGALSDNSQSAVKS